jgi:hypothetical protein
LAGEQNGSVAAAAHSDRSEAPVRHVEHSLAVQHDRHDEVIVSVSRRRHRHVSHPLDSKGRILSQYRQRFGGGAAFRR